MSTGKQKHILVGVLDWGLGHATRSIPIIKCLLANQCNVSVAGNGSSLQLLKQEFPQLIFHELPSYGITYPTHRFFFLHVLTRVPRIFNVIQMERKKVQILVEENNIDAIISDNRYGCYSDKVPSVLITHQLNIQLPAALKWSTKWLNNLNRRLINKFSECWVPDFHGSPITGKLTESNMPTLKFIGTLSRFVYTDSDMEDGSIVGLVSGPEPQREIFEKLLKKEFNKLNRKCWIVRGLPFQQSDEVRVGNVTFIAHASASALQQIINRADIIISRSGYSTLMDLHRLGKKNVIFIPTPGQTEQEYLAHLMEAKKVAYTQSQDKLDIKYAIQKVKEYTGFDASKHHPNLLNEAIQLLLRQI